jgi:hypothetical protein
MYLCKEATQANIYIMGGIRPISVKSWQYLPARWVSHAISFSVSIHHFQLSIYNDTEQKNKTVPGSTQILVSNGFQSKMDFVSRELYNIA